MGNFPISIFQLIVLIFSIVVHEISHGLIANRLGDDTAKKMGRLTFNPLKHLDPTGSIFIPLFLMIVNSPILVGWAKPVPYNPLNLKNPKTGSALIALGGPLSNLTVAAIFGILIRIIAPFINLQSNGALIALVMLFNIIVFINILLAIFNLVPIPPLDGSKILFALIPDKYWKVKNWLEKYGMILLLMFIFFGFNLIIPAINGVYRLLVGQWGMF